MSCPETCVSFPERKKEEIRKEPKLVYKRPERKIEIIHRIIWIETTTDKQNYKAQFSRFGLVNKTIGVSFAFLSLSFPPLLISVSSMNEIKKRRTAARYCLLRCDDSEKSSSIWQRWRWLYNKTERATFFFSPPPRTVLAPLFFISFLLPPLLLSPFPSPPYFSFQRRITRLNYFLRKYRETWSGSLYA